MLLFIGTTELMIIGVVLIVLFGSKQIPNIVKGFKEVKKAKDDISEDIKNETSIIKDITDIGKTLKK